MDLEELNLLMRWSWTPTFMKRTYGLNEWSGRKFVKNILCHLQLCWIVFQMCRYYSASAMLDELFRIVVNSAIYWRNFILCCLQGRVTLISDFVKKLLDIETNIREKLIEQRKRPKRWWSSWNSVFFLHLNFRISILEDLLTEKRLLAVYITFQTVEMACMETKKKLWIHYSSKTLKHYLLTAHTYFLRRTRILGKFRNYASIGKKMKRKPTPFASQKDGMRSLMNNYIIQTCLEVNADQQRQS